MANGHYRDNNRGRLGVDTTNKLSRQEKKTREIVKQSYLIIREAGPEGITRKELKGKIGHNSYYLVNDLILKYFGQVVKFENDIWSMKTSYEKNK